MLNAVFYGLIVVSMSVTALVPELQEDAIASVDRDLSQEGLAAALVGADEQGNVLTSAGLTLLINVLLGVVITMVAPSLLVPFLGLAMGVYRTITWGFLFSPIAPEAQVAFIPHSLTVLIEGQAYIVVMLAIWVHTGATGSRPDGEAIPHSAATAPGRAISVC